MALSRTNSRFFLGLCLIGALAIMSSTMSKNPVLPLFAKFLGADGAQLGIIAASSTIPGILISLPAGSLSDLYGRRRVLLISLLIFASAPFLYFLVTEPWHLMLVRFYHGFATAIFGPVANAAIAERYPERKGERISLFSSATLIGRSLAPFLGGFVLFASSYSSVYLVVAATSVSSLAIGILLFRKNHAPPRAENDGDKGPLDLFLSSLRTVSGDLRILAISFVEAVQFFTFGAFEFFLILYANSVGLNTLRIGVVSGAQLVVVLVTKPAFGSISDRVGRRPMILFGLLLGSASLFVVSTATEFSPILLLSVVYGFGFSAVTSSTVPFVSDLVSKDSYGYAMGFISTIMDIGQTMGPIVTGILIASSGYGFSFVTLSVLLLISCAVILPVTGRRTRETG